MQVSDFAKLVNSVQYKPGWDIRLSDGWEVGPAMSGAMILRLYHDEPAANGNGDRADAINQDAVGRDQIQRWTRDEAIEYLRTRIMDAETHEFKEFFRIDGVQWFDPHPELGERPGTRSPGARLPEAAL